jgi:dTDP-4-dehydrorhamnose reductase
MLGTDVLAALDGRGIAYTGVDRGDLDLFDEDAVDRAVAEHEVVLNCAAWTAVDDAETQEVDAYRINALAPEILATAAARHGSRLVHVSTDYVFDGTARSPYAEDAPAEPASAYGRTKAAGEAAVRAAAPEHHLLVRTAWLYGAHGACFPKTMARLARERGAVSVVDDQFGQPTWTADVADLILRLVEADAPAGTWHATSTGETSWFEFARQVVEAAGLDPEIVSATDSASFVRPAARPAYSVLGHDRLRAAGIEPIGPWQQRWQQAAPQVLLLEQPQ